MKIDVYRNLNEDTLSIRSREPEDYGKVVAHKEKVTVRNAEFIVQPAGLRKTRENEVKNVHAFVRGEWDDSANVLVADSVVTYDPFKHDTFVEQEYETPVVAADVATVTRKGVFTKNPKSPGEK